MRRPILLCLLFFSVLVLSDCPPLTPPIFPPIKLPGFCTMYGGNCDKPPQQYVNCLNNTRAIEPSFAMPFCPEYSSSSCCDFSQYSLLDRNLQSAENLFGGCPACFDNFRQLWCQFTCSSDQSVFVDVTSSKVGSLGESVVTSAAFDISNQYSENLWESCDNVKFGSTGMPIVKILFGASTALEFLCFQGVPEPQGQSPFLINFNIKDSGSLSNTSTQHSCNEMINNNKCTCDDCPASCPDACASNPCLNGGICENNPFSLSYECFCPMDSAGKNCQCTCPLKEDAKVCNLKCGVHGACRFLDDDTPICYCDNPWMGEKCQFHQSQCS